MAVGGIPDIHNLTEFQENIQAQYEEIAVLQSIFDGDEERLHVLDSAESSDDNQDKNSSHQDIKMYIPVKVPENMHVEVYLPLETSEETEVDVNKDRVNGKQAFGLERSESGQRMIFNFEVLHLPPVCVHVMFPPTYPSTDQPYFLVSCVWLSPQQLTLLCREFDRLWQDNKGDDHSPGMPILYTWLDWVQESLLKTLGIDSQLSVTSHVIDEETDDCRVAIETEDLNSIVTEMMRFNRQEQMKVFRKSTQECNICFEQNFGHNFFLLPECGHHICKECLGSHCQLLVKEGSVLQISCPMCKAFIPPYILKEVLTEEEFLRFESLSLVKSLETMGDVKWCPRCNNPVIVEPDQGLKLAQCMACFFTFCTDCMDKWHQGEKCKGDEDVSDELPEIDEKDVRRKEYIIKTLEQERQNKHSKMYIRKMTKRCPKCTSPIMKTGGCNKVVCTYCSTSMCYICEKQIDGYKHFADSPKCNTFTFEEDLIDNTDIRQPEHHGFLPINAAAQRVLRNALPNTTGKQINDRIKDNPELRDRSFRCSACKQVNIKETASNHKHCWNCKVSVCFYCKQKITGTVGKHFAGINSCPQHTAI